MIKFLFPTKSMYFTFTTSIITHQKWFLWAHYCANGSNAITWSKLNYPKTSFHVEMYITVEWNHKILRHRVISSYHSLHLLNNKIKWFHFDSNLINIEISIRGWQDEIEGINNQYQILIKRTRPSGVLSNTVHECNK